LLLGVIALLFGANGFYQGRPQGSPLRSQFIALSMWRLLKKFLLLSRENVDNVINYLYIA